MPNYKRSAIEGMTNSFSFSFLDCAVKPIIGIEESISESDGKENVTKVAGAF